jgi:DNA-binding SARP family transcriptional activator
MSVWLSLLGALRVESQGTEWRVPAAKQRALLAMLAVNANSLVTMDALAEAMWGSQLPPSKDDTVRTYVHRLRRQLGQDVGKRVLTQPPGYLLQVDPDELDLLRFEALIKDGRTRFEVGDWAGASARLTAAEALWRGTPLADIPSRLAHDRYICYLEQTRLAALGWRIESDIRVSRHSAAGIIPELQEVTARHPERERLCLLLMLALYRAGRQAEALREFSEARRFSIAEYGVDPGPELTDIHKRILAQDPGLLSEPLDRSSLS